MLKAKEYLPIGSVVLLNNGIKELMIIGILPQHIGEDNNIIEADYLGVLYPEGYMGFEDSFMFNKSDIKDVVFRGYDSEDRAAYLDILQENMDIVEAARNK